MSREEMLEQRNEACRERHVLAVDRLRSIVAEETVLEKYLSYFQDVTIFLRRQLGEIQPEAEAEPE